MRSVRMALVGAMLPVLVATAAAPPQPRQGAHPDPGYHHLGATTAGTWSGVRGRMTVTDPAVRRGTYDFVATRFMAKRDLAGGTRWLEAGWAETGWAAAGRQRIYTFDTNTNTWVFYDQYPLVPGEQIWISLTSVRTPATTGAAMWSAWLWWRGGWHLLTTQALAIGERATLEQYVEIYADPAHRGELRVPRITLDEVSLTPLPGAPEQPWSSPAVPTESGTDVGSYCVAQLANWRSWQAGSC